MRILKITSLLTAMLLAAGGVVVANDQKQADQAAAENKPMYTVYPIGWVRKENGKTTIVIDKQYQKAMLGLEDLTEIWVLYWFDRNDTPQKRSILRVHPRGNPANPIRGVFATRAPVRPNLIAMSRCKIISVKDNVIEIEDIDASPDTPMLDLKP